MPAAKISKQTKGELLELQRYFRVRLDQLYDVGVLGRFLDADAALRPLHRRLDGEVLRRSRDKCTLPRRAAVELARERVRQAMAYRRRASAGADAGSAACLGCTSTVLVRPPVPEAGRFFPPNPRGALCLPGRRSGLRGATTPCLSCP